MAEAVLPESDADAVRIMTVHAAKGLEFPIVILSGMSSQRRPRSGVGPLWTATGYEVRTGKAAETEEFDIARPVDERMGDLEHIRLLYVAATRARDHLVLSLHRTEKKSKTSALVLAEALPEGFDEEHPPLEIGPVDHPLIPQVAPPPPFEQWHARAESARENATTVVVHSASVLEGTAPELVLAEATEQQQGAAKGPRDAELPPWSKGRYGSAIGRAVHGVLQIVDLAAGPGTVEFTTAVEAQSVAEGVVAQSELVATLAASALNSDVVRRASTREHWRETFVATVEDEARSWRASSTCCTARTTAPWSWSTTRPTRSRRAASRAAWRTTAHSSRRTCGECGMRPALRCRACCCSCTLGGGGGAGRVKRGPALGFWSPDTRGELRGAKLHVLPHQMPEGRSRLGRPSPLGALRDSARERWVATNGRVVI